LLSHEFLSKKRTELDEYHADLSGLPDPEASFQPSADRWSIKQVLGHLIDSASNNHQRFIRLQSSDIRFPYYDQNIWVVANQYQSSDFGLLLQLWYSYNLQILHLLQFVPGSSLEHKWLRDDGSEVTLAFIIEDYFRHLTHHIERIRERRTARHGV
jgi:hypothetical protein